MDRCRAQPSGQDQGLESPAELSVRDSLVYSGRFQRTRLTCFAVALTASVLDASLQSLRVMSSVFCTSREAAKRPEGPDCRRHLPAFKSRGSRTVCNTSVCTQHASFSSVSTTTETPLAGNRSDPDPPIGGPFTPAAIIRSSKLPLSVKSRRWYDASMTMN